MQRMRSYLDHEMHRGLWVLSWVEIYDGVRSMVRARTAGLHDAIWTVPVAINCVKETQLSQAETCNYPSAHLGGSSQCRHGRQCCTPLRTFRSRGPPGPG